MGKERSPEIASGEVSESAHRVLPAFVLSVLLVISPLPFGASHGWAVSSIEVTVFLVVALLFAFEGAARPARQLGSLALPAGLLLAFLLLQTVPLPLAWLRWLSPHTAALYGELNDDLARWFTLSVDPYDSLLSLLRLAAYGGVFVIASQAPLPGRGSLLYWAILASGGLAAGLSWWHAYAGWDTELFGQFAPYDQIGTSTRLHWPLVNANHLAAGMNVTWPIALGAVLWPKLLGAREASSESWTHRTLAAAAFLLSFSALLGTSSRGGLGAALVGAFAMVMLWPSRSKASRRAFIAVRVVAIVALGAGVFWIGWEAAQPPRSDVTLAALERRDATLQVRLEIARQSSGLIRDFTGFGTGLGTWPEIFPRYQRYPLLFASIPHLHSDALEWLSDVGVVGFGLLCFLALRYARRVTLCVTDEGRKERAILSAALITLAAHAAGEFALRIPSIALVAAALLGLLWRETGEMDDAASADGPPFSLLDRMAAITGLFGLLYLATFEWRDSALLAAARDGLAIALPEHSGAEAYEQLGWRRMIAGESGVDAALRAVIAAPVRARSHRTLAYCYRNALMSERELARAVICEPANRQWRIEHALFLGSIGRFQLALRELEQAFYLNPQYGDAEVLKLEDPIDGSRPLLTAALRGVRRRVEESPEATSELARFEQDRRQWQLERERKQRGN